MKLIYILILFFLTSCLYTPQDINVESMLKLGAIWEKISSGDTSGALRDIESNLKETSTAVERSHLYDAKGWAYYVSANGLKNDPKYKLAMAAFLLSDEQDSMAGRAIVGNLIESYTESMNAAILFLPLPYYSHSYAFKNINLKAVLLNGAWSAYFLRKWMKSKKFLNVLDSRKWHYENPDSLFIDLKKIIF